MRDSRASRSHARGNDSHGRRCSRSKAVHVVHHSAGRGIAIREFRMARGYVFANYLLCLDKHGVGALGSLASEGWSRGSAIAEVYGKMN